MPFTIAHPGFALLLSNKRYRIFDSIGLIIGSVVPDFDIIFRLTHSRLHLFIYDFKEVFLIILPIGLGVSLYFHWVHGKIMKTTFKLSINTIIKISISCLLAISLHLLLDTFTHLDATKIVVEFDHQTDYSYRFYNNLYYFLLYGPTTFASIIGILLLYFFYQNSSFNLGVYFGNDSFIRKKILICSLAIFLGIFLLKLIISGIEAHFFLDSLVIALTASFIGVCCIAPLLILFFRRKS